MVNKEATILIIDKSLEERTKLWRLLSPRYKVDVASSATEGLNKLLQSSYSLILLDFETLSLQVESFVNSLREKEITAKLALMTKLHLEEYISLIRQWEITNVLPKREDYPPERMMIVIENFIYPERAFGLRRYLQTSPKSEEIRTRDDKPYVVSKVINFFGANGFSSAKLYDVRLALEEGINNALYHAFRDNQGNKKYNPENFQQLAPEEKIKVDYGCGGGTGGFAVSDNQGILTPKQIIETLCRQYDKQSLYSQSGRGLFLCRRFTESLIINIRHNNLTQLIALFQKEDTRDEETIKPFFINYIE